MIAHGMPCGHAGSIIIEWVALGVMQLALAIVQ